MRARSYHASPGEITSVGGCAQHLPMNCASTPDGGAVPADVPGETLAAPPPVTRTDAVWPAGLGEGPEGIASVPAPDGYPHVTCGCPVTGRRPHGVVAAVARRHRERRMAVTRTPAPGAGQRARRVELARSRQASGRDARRYCREFPGDDRPAGHLGGQEHPLGEGRAPRPASARRPDHQPGEGRGAGLGTAGTGSCPWPWPWPSSYSRRRHQPATGTSRVGPDRPAARLADPRPAMASDSGWA